ncbi:hypothetical protein BJX64DRAFT_282846 [Aspergillus heterothallicus]
MSGRIKQKYPVSIPELSEAEITLLIQALQTDILQSISAQHPITYDGHTDGAIKSLPQSLRARLRIHLITAPAFFSTAALCNIHKGLNKYIISQFIRMIKREIGGHLDRLTDYIREPLEAELDDLVCTLRSVAGMWCSPPPSGDSSYPQNPVPYQANKCEACMITRILMDPKCVQYLRATVHSRVRTTCNYRSPKLRRATDAIMGTYDKKLQEQIIKSSTKLVLGLKQARKEAFREKQRALHENYMNRQDFLPQSRTRYLENANRSNGQTLSSFTVDFCMIQEATSPEGISPQEETQPEPQDHGQPIHLDGTESTNHKLRFSLLDTEFMSPEEAAFANNSQNEEQQQQILYEIIDYYMSSHSARSSITSSISPITTINLENVAASAQPYIISPLSLRKHSFRLPRKKECERKNEYDPTNGMSWLHPPLQDVDWGPILQRGKRGSPMDKLISQIGDLLEMPDEAGSRTASERAKSYIAVLPDPNKAYSTDEDDEVAGELSKSDRTETMSTSWSLLLRDR